jgi:hypothetical protein
MIAAQPLTEKLKRIARVFLKRMREGDYESVWYKLITPEAARLLSVASFPIQMYKENKLDELLTITPDNNVPLYFDEAIAFAFQTDISGIRSSVFAAVAEGFESMGWYEFSDNNAYAFFNGSAAVLIADTKGTTTMLLPFVKYGDREYKVDFEALSLFSMVFSATLLYNIGKRALELGRRRSAVEYFDLAASLGQSYTRLRSLVWNHPIVGQLITASRKNELEKEYEYVMLAKEQARALLRSIDPSSKEVIGENMKSQTSFELFRTRLHSCLPGREHFSEYEDLGLEILEFLFSPAALDRVKRQPRTLDNTQRRDVLFRNQRTRRFWQRIAERLHADFVIVDFKNYEEPVTQNVLNDVQKYANDALGRFILVLSRVGSHISTRAYQLRLYRDHKTVILVVSDDQLLEMIQRKEEGKEPEGVLEEMYDDLLLDY